MKHGILPRALLAAVLLIAPFAAPAQVAVPPLKARVTDLTSTLTADQRAALEQKLAALEAKKGSQVAVLLVSTVQPEAIEQYSIRVVDQWKLGRKGVDDGVLLLVAKNDRALRIEVGRGLEGAIPDAYAKRIMDEEIVPRFKQGDFYGGITAGVDRVASLIDGEPMPPPAGASRPSGPGFDSDWFFFGLVAMLAIAGMVQSVLGRFLGSVVLGGIAAVVVYFLAGIGIALVAGVVVFLATLTMGGSMGGGGWSSGRGGGGWSSGGGGGGGFGGGGGGFGGGGASGRW